MQLALLMLPEVPTGRVMCVLTPQLPTHQHHTHTLPVLLCRMMHTAHVWNTRTMKVERVVDLSGITDGLMESRYSGYPGLFWVSGGMGKL